MQLPPHEYIAAMRCGSADPSVESDSGEPVSGEGGGEQPQTAREGVKAAGKFLGGLMSRAKNAVSSAVSLIFFIPSHMTENSTNLMIL